MKIQILTDKSSWLNEYNIILQDRLIVLGHDVAIIHSKEELEKGDVAFFLSCFEIVDKEYLNLHNNNIVIHESDLPYGKGWSPLTWQVLEGKNVIPVCLFEASESCDSGKVYFRDYIELDGYELVDELRLKQGMKTVELAENYIIRFNELDGVEQMGKELYFAKRTAEDSELDINKPLIEQFNLLRVVDNDRYPAFFIKDGVKYLLKIEKCQNM